MESNGLRYTLINEDINEGIPDMIRTAWRSGFDNAAIGRKCTAEEMMKRITETEITRGSCSMVETVDANLVRAEVWDVWPSWL